MPNYTADPWAIGDLDKGAIWATYVVLNFVGSFLCGVLVLSVCRMPQRSATDVLVAGLCSGCIWMSMTCGVQCMLSAAHGEFYGEGPACRAEAFAHVSGIITQFLCNALLSLRGLLAVVFEVTVSARGAAAAVLGAWGAAVLGTVVAGAFSDIYLMSAGTYCFFGFDQPAIVYWLVPVLAAAVVCMAVSFAWIVFFVRRVKRRVWAEGSPRIARYESASVLKAALRSFVYVAVLLAGWIVAPVAMAVELSGRRADAAVVTALGVGGTSHTVLVALVYGYTSPYHRSTLRRLFTCRLCASSPTGKYTWRVGMTVFERSSELADGSDRQARASGRASRPTRASPKTPISHNHAFRESKLNVYTGEHTRRRDEHG